MDRRSQLEEAIKGRDAQALRAAIPGTPGREIAWALNLCAHHGYLAGIVLLRPNCKPDDHSQAMQTAARYGELEIVRYLSERLNSVNAHTKALVGALVAGEVECIRFLLPMSNLHKVVQISIDNEIHHIDLIASHLSHGQLQALATSNIEPSLMPQIHERFEVFQRAKQLEKTTPPVKISPHLKSRL